MTAAAGIRPPQRLRQARDRRTAWAVVTDAVRVLSVTRPAFSALLNERATVSPEMAHRREKAFGVSMDIPMRMQNSHVIVEVGERNNEIRVTQFTGNRWPTVRELHVNGSRC